MQEETEIEIYLAVPMPSYELIEKEKETCRKNLYTMLDEITHSSGLTTFSAGSGELTPSFELVSENGRKYLSSFKLFDKESFRKCEFVKVSAIIPLDIYSECHNAQYDQETNASIRATVARIELCKHISDMMVFANIARLGSIEVLASVIVQEGQLLDYSSIPQMDGLAAQRAAEIAMKIEWPSLEPLPLKRVLEWSQARHKRIDGFEGSSTSRALAAFSRLFEKITVDEPMQLLWALVGIEAIYVSGKSELLQQVREKSQVFLGAQESYKRILSRMYDFRSRFVHGDLGFPCLALIEDATDDVEKYDEGLMEATSVAVAVLCATLQEIIRRDWYGLDFSYTAYPDH